MDHLYISSLSAAYVSLRMRRRSFQFPPATNSIKVGIISIIRDYEYVQFSLLIYIEIHWSHCWIELVALPTSGSSFLLEDHLPSPPFSRTSPSLAYRERAAVLPMHRFLAISLFMQCIVVGASAAICLVATSQPWCLLLPRTRISISRMSPRLDYITTSLSCFAVPRC
jgi:hypothetical protein